ncbi:biliverdin-producing heme oxygenase [Laribacter hongkongensis]|uniref:biliverdin-producing heme oxygenase n=1 Tax=Laribacter hongkongensis TaxID=168471 RepID=UPI001EFC3A57|nr:biliverdin-producing heme oxygenase [Laribacter hongkongensis]MCG9053580.1 biliverdin-producing heme oxygenase [Laribacter hongkongensis]MCG9083909.1 biliverdin-producing heme oxygenase [Laribacter hongkongensis]
MVDSLLTLPGSAPAPIALYCHTQALHAALQGWWLETGLFGGMLDQQAYRNILTRLHRCFSMLEHELTSRHAGLLDEIGYLPRLSLLDADLAELGIERTFHKQLWPCPLPDRAAALGALYVIEGAAYAGQHMLSQLMLYPFGAVACRYFVAYGDEAGRHWLRFCNLLREELDSPAALVQSAQYAEAVFRLFLDPWHPLPAARQAAGGCTDAACPG